MFTIGELPALPEKHRRFLDRALPLLMADARVLGVAAGGSLRSGTFDEYSDLDLVVVVRPEAREEVMAQRKAIAGGLGPVLTVFSAEHVGEPRMVIAIYGPPPLHVDLKFVAPAEFAERVEDPLILGEKEGAITAVFASSKPKPPGPLDLDWLEERFWCWIHYSTEKTLRGEWAECQTCTSFLTSAVLGPMALSAAGFTGLDRQGVRRLEVRAPQAAAVIRGCMSADDRASYLRAWLALANLYGMLREQLRGKPWPVSDAERTVREYLTQAMTR